MISKHILGICGVTVYMYPNVPPESLLKGLPRRRCRSSVLTPGGIDQLPLQLPCDRRGLPCPAAAGGGLPPVRRCRVQVMQYSHLSAPQLHDSRVGKVNPPAAAAITYGDGSTPRRRCSNLGDQGEGLPPPHRRSRSAYGSREGLTPHDAAAALGEVYPPCGRPSTYCI